MSLREVLKNYNIKTGISELKELPEISTVIREEKKRIKLSFNPIDEPMIDVNNLEKTIPKIINHFKIGNIKNLSPSLKKKIPFCIWFEKQPLKNYEYIVNFYLDDAIEKPSKRTMWNLMYAYFENYNLNDFYCKKIGNKDRKSVV